jgi:3-oxoacyl-[acyl-carrier protein] reductase
MEKMLQDQVALITGGTAGIGKAIALLFADSGAKVAIFGTNAERGKQVVEEIHVRTGKSDRAIFYGVNVAKTQEVDQAIKQVLETFGTVDVLVNNAGITRDQLLMKMSEEDWDLVLETNLKSCYNTCRALVRPMMRARKGSIINMSSIIGLTGNPGQVNYAASKSAMIGLSKALAKEVASRQIRVNCICPGFIETSMTEILTADQREAITTKIPLGVIGSTEDVAQAALFLAGPQSKYITGQVIVVDGGLAM